MSEKAVPRLLRVNSAWRLTPNMIRVTLSGEDLSGFPAGHEGGNCKLLLPEPEETIAAFRGRLLKGPPPVRRTFTVRSFREDAQELDIDFVAHGDEGPASRWATHAKPGDFLGFMGPSQPKISTFDADWYLLAADPSAIPVAAATLEAMPRQAQGIAVFEIPTAEDQQQIQAPEGIALHWLVNPEAPAPSARQLAFVEQLALPPGRIQTCIAGESGVIRALKNHLKRVIDQDPKDAYVSGYWKYGLIEDQHQALKRKESASGP